jgi:type III secretory pathway lipoprotein EscJ
MMPRVMPRRFPHRRVRVAAPAFPVVAAPAFPVVAAACAAVLAVVAAGCEEPDLRRVPQRQAIEAARLLDDAGMEPRVEPDGKTASGAAAFTVRVGRGDLPDARRVLSENNLPREPAVPPGDSASSAGGGAGGVESALSGLLIPDGSAEHAKRVAAAAAELSAGLESHPGVLSAAVWLAVPERPTLADPATPGKPKPAARASVLIRHRPDNGRPPLTAAEVQQIVAGRVVGLEPSAVSVVMTPAAPDRATAEVRRSGWAEFWKWLHDSRNWLVPVLSLVSLVQGGLLLRSALRRRGGSAGAAGAAGASRPPG